METTVIGGKRFTLSGFTKLKYNAKIIQKELKSDGFLSKITIENTPFGKRYYVWSRKK